MSDRPVGPSVVRRITIALAVTAGVFGSLDTALNIAFPDLIDDLALSLADLGWIVASYVASYGLTLVVAGRLGDRFDHGRIVMIGGAASAVALGACASAASYETLLVARAAQGIAAALVMAGAPALLSTTGAGVTGVASIFQTAAGAGLAIGPIIGGLAVTAGGWRAVFWVRVPLALGLVGLGVVLRLAARWSVVERDDSTRSSPAAAATAPIPNRVFVAANSLTALVNGSLFVTWLLVPSLLIDEVGLSAFAGGLVLAVSPLATAVASNSADRWIGRFGSGPVAVGGVAAGTVGLALMAAVAAIGPPAVVPAIVASMALVGFGLGLFGVPNMAMVLGALPADRQGLAGGLNLTMRTLGIVLGANGAGLLFARQEGLGWSFLGAFRATFAAAVIVGLIAVALTRWTTSHGRPDRAVVTT